MPGTRLDSCSNPSGAHGLNEELGRYRGKNGKTECTLCDAECESVVTYSISGRLRYIEIHALLSFSLCPQLVIRGMPLW